MRSIVRPPFEELMKATARLGDAVVDPATWPDIMADMSRAVRAEGALLLQGDVFAANAHAADVPRTASISEYVDIYFDRGRQFSDVRIVKSIPLMLRGQPTVIDQDILSPDEMRQDATYNEIYIPRGFQWFAAIGFRAGTALWALPFQRTIAQGPFEREDKRILAQFSRRLSEAATLSQAVGRSVLTAAVNALHLVRQPAVVLDRLGFVLDANAAADQMFDSEIRVSNRRLAVTDGRARAELERVTDALRAAGDTTPLPAEPIVVRRRSKPPVLIRILPIEAAARSPFLGARALLTLVDLSARKRPPSQLLATSFGLTAAEAEIAALIGAGETIATAADRLGVTAHTARNQLKAVFSKTDTHRQAELVALLAQLRLGHTTFADITAPPAAPLEF
jgi:DNA-binding CsgD family transcriptional regulator